MYLLKLSVLGLLLTLQQTCQRDGSDKKDLLSTGWELVSINNNSPDSGLKAPTLFFAENEKKVNGFAGCNKFFGTYTLSGDSLTFSGLGSTKMFCEQSMELENQYLGLLAKTENFVVSQNGTVLTLLSAARPVLVFNKEEAR
ncbi:MAG TPA: META domain-containing protein [Anseongella sp.]|nr:META domain-containing protein [Anseongella sp.]